MNLDTSICLLADWPGVPPSLMGIAGIAYLAVCIAAVFASFLLTPRIDDAHGHIIAGAACGAILCSFWSVKLVPVGAAGGAFLALIGNAIAQWVDDD